MKLYIYKIHPIEETEETLCYIGSSTNPKNRFLTHKILYERWKNNLGTYCSSYKLFDEYGFDKLKISILEVIECENKKDHRMVEFNYIRETLNSVNILKGYCIEDLKKYLKEYKKNSPYYICECGSKIKKNCKSMHKKTSKHKKYLDMYIQ